MKRFKKELSWLLVAALVMSSLVVGFGQLKTEAVANVGTGLVAVHIQINSNDCANGTRGTDSSFRLQFLNAGGTVISQTANNAIEGRPEQSSWGDPLEAGQTTTFAANAGQGGNVQFITAVLGTMTVTNTITQVQLVNTYWEDDWAFNNVVVKYSYDGGSNWVDISSGGWSSGSSGAVGTWAITWFGTNVKTLAFNANGGSGGGSYEAIPGQTITQPGAPTRTGYTFAGWSGVPARMPNSNQTYYAAWNLNYWNLTYNANGGTGGSGPTSTGYGTALTAPTVSRTGYTHTGWSPAVPATMPNAASTYTAQWSINSYTITFNGNGGSTPSAITQNYGTAVTAPANPTRAGYTFTGWSPACPSTMPAGNTTCVAQWSANTNTPYTVQHYVVNVALNGWDYVESETLYGTTDTTVSAPHKSYAGFYVWDYPDDTGNINGNGSTVLIQRYWRYSYNITFDANGGNGGAGATSMIYGGSLSAPSPGTRTGYTFTGWSPSVPSTVGVGDTTYTAQWSINTYYVIFDANGGSGSMSNQSIQYGSSAALTSNAFSRTGYTFTGWNTVANGSGTAYGNGASYGPIGAGNVTLYAQWSINTYYVIFDANGGSGSMSNQGIQYGSSAALTSNAFSRTGYTFTGWNTIANGSGTAYGNGASYGPIGAGNVTMYAQWSINTYYVIFDANGGSGSMSNQGIVYGQSAALTANAFSRTGYTFTGWNTIANGSGTAYGNGVSYGPIGASNVTLYAQWSANTYYVQFSANGGSGSMSNQGIVYGQSATLTANAFSRTGYTFTGWNTVANGSGTAYANGASYGPIGAGNVTLYAQWSINAYTITFNGNGGTTPSPISQNYATTVTAPANPTRTGYTFTGWSPAVPPVMPAENTECVAQWSINTYYIQFNVNGGSGSMSNQGIQYGSSAALTSNAFSRTGYTFTGWNTAANGSGTAYANQASYGPIGAGDVTLYAQWSANTYYVQFNANSGSGSMSDQGIVFGQSAALTINSFTRTGYTFTGWNTAANGSGTAYANQASYGPIGAGNVTLYAQWSANTYYVQFNANSGSGSMSDQGIVFGQSAALTTNSFARTGYTFTGWNTAANGSGTAYANQASYGPIGAGNVTLYAQWSANTYYVQFNANSGSGSMSDQGIVFGQSAALTTNSFARTGYTFTGWNTAANGSGTAYANQASYGPIGAGNVTLYAQWSANTYYVQFNANSGSGSMSDQGIVFDQSASLTANAFSRTGYTFTGWNTAANGSGTAYAEQASYGPIGAGNVTLYAQWSINTYYVVFDANGGSGSMSDQGIVYGQSAALTTNAFARTGYTFTGWNTAANGSGTAYAEQASYGPIGAGNVTLYAQWSINTYYVIFDANGGSGSMSNQGIVYGQSASLTANAFSRTGYTFTGWNTAANGSGTAYAEQASYGPIGAGNVTLYAQWSINTYYVIFDANGGSGSLSDQGIVFGQSASLTANAFSRTGYTFTEWNTAANGSGTAYAEQASYGPIGAGNVTLYAQWSINTYYVVFDANGGSGSISDQGIVFGQSASLTANAFSRTGYTFTGWNTTANGSGTAYADQASYGPIGASNVTLYAQWSINTYYVVFDANGGSGSMSDQGIVFGQSASLTANAFSRTGYTFAGWNTAANGSGTAYAEQASYGPIGAGDVTLYAQWTGNTYYVAFNANTGSGSMTDMTFAYGTAQNLTANSFSKTGYTFTGWNTIANGSGTTYPEQESVNNLATGGTVTLYAQWSIGQYSITFNANGGTSISSITQNYATTVTAPADPSRTGYTFNGWSPAVPAVMPAENTQCVAQWSANQYTVTFDANGGSVSPNSKDVTYDSNYGTLPVPELEGYSLDGWFTGSSGGTQVTDATAVTILAPQTLYAQWTMIPADFEEIEAVISFEYSAADLGTTQVLDELGEDQGSIYLYGNASLRQSVSDAYDDAVALQALAPLADTATNRGLIAAASSALSDAIDTLLANPNPAVYTFVDAEITQANQINLNRYTTASLDELQTAVDNVVEDKPAAQQSAVNGYAAALYNQRAGASALIPYQDNKAPKLSVFETTETMLASGISIDGFDPEDFGDISYVYPGKNYYTYFCYTNSENPVVLINIADLADSNGRVSYPANMDVSKVSGTVNSGWMSYTYDGGTRAGTVDEGSVALANNPYASYSVGMEYDPALGADYYRQSGYLVIKPQFVQGTSKQFARYTISGVDDASASGNTADSTSLAGGNAVYANGKLIADVPNTPHPTWSPEGTITIYVEYRNSMSLDSGTWYDDGRASTSIKAYNNLLADDEWVNKDYLYRVSGGAANSDMIGLGDTIYSSNDPNYAKKGLACFYYFLDDTRDASIISAYGDGSGVAAATALIKTAIQTDTGGAYSSHSYNWAAGNTSISGFDPNTSSRLVYVHLVDRWGNVFNKIIKTNNVDAGVPDFSDITAGTATLNEAGGSGVSLVKLYEYAYEGAPQYVVNCYSDKLIETLNVINEPENVLDISVGHSTVVDGLHNKFTLYTKDKAGNEKTQTVFTDSAGNLAITVNDPENMSPPQGKSMGARAMAEPAANIYTFLLNDTITVNLNNPTQPETYTISFDLNGGTSAAIDPIELEEGAAVTAPADPAKEGYTFAGWLPEVPAVMPSGDISCVAQWLVNEAVTLVPADGSNTVISTPYIYGLWEGIGQEDFESNAVRVTGNGRIEITTLAGFFGTGTKVQLIDNASGDTVETYYIIIFGDMNGDGIAGSIDADLIYNYENYFIEWSYESEPYLFKAGDLNGDSNVGSVDADIIYNYENYLMWIDQTTGLALEY